MRLFDFYSPQTKRQLLKAFRDVHSIVNSIIECNNRGSKYYLGNPIVRELLNAKTERQVVKNILLQRDLTINQRKEIESLELTKIKSKNYSELV